MTAEAATLKMQCTGRNSCRRGGGVGVHVLKSINGVHVQLKFILSRDTRWRLVVKFIPHAL